MKKINLAILSLVLLTAISSPVFAQTTTATNVKTKTQIVKTVVKKANLDYAAAISKANAEYNAAVKSAKQTYSSDLVKAKTKEEKTSALKTEKATINAAKKVRTAAHTAALNTLKATKNSATK